MPIVIVPTYPVLQTPVMGNLAEIVETTAALLGSRHARPADFEAENRALRRLANEMADHPDRVLRTLCEQVIEVCGAESAGVSLLKSDVTP
jgi:hypothetical protein